MTIEGCLAGAALIALYSDKRVRMDECRRFNTDPQTDRRLLELERVIEEVRAGRATTTKDIDIMRSLAFACQALRCPIDLWEKTIKVSEG